MNHCADDKPDNYPCISMEKELNNGPIQGACCRSPYQISQHYESLSKVQSFTNPVQVVTSSDNDRLPSYSPSKMTIVGIYTCLVD